MAVVLVATSAGCRTFADSGESKPELSGRQVFALAPDAGGACLAVIDGHEIWRRSPNAEWSRVATSDVGLASIVSVGGTIYGGSMVDAVMVRISENDGAKRLRGFDIVPGRNKWFAEGPPLHVRSMTATADGKAIMAAVHVGGIPCSTDGGETWAPTVPIEFDVHEVRAHASLSIVAAAAAVGLCVSHDGGQSWKVFADGPQFADSLAVAVLNDEVLFSIQEGPFADRSQLWRWRIDGSRIEQVREGLPEWMNGKIDTAHIAAGEGRAALIDKGGNLWLSKNGSKEWEHIANDLQNVYGVQILPAGTR